MPDLAPVFFALGDRTRLRLVAVLCAGGAFSIAQLTANTQITRQAVTKHLQVLADAGLVKDLKIGRERLPRGLPNMCSRILHTGNTHAVFGTIGPFHRCLALT